MSEPLPAAAWLGALGVRHNGDIDLSVARVLDDTPPEMRKEILSVRREKVNRGVAAGSCLTNDVLGERTSNAAAAMSRINEDAREPRREVWMCLHLTMNKHSRAE